MKQLIAHTLEIAHRQIGVREEPPGSNRGDDVERYLRTIGLSGGYAWCAAMVYSDAHDAAVDLNQTNPLPRTGYCPELERYARINKILKTSPEVGDVFLSYGSPEGYRRASHTGHVIEVRRRSFVTIEGNTNLGGSREGIGVFKRERPLDSSRYSFIRWADVVLDVPATVIEKLPAPRMSIGQVYDLWLGGRFSLAMPVIDNRAYAPVRGWARKLGIDCGWDNAHQVVLLGGREAPLDIYKGPDNMAFAPIRQLVKFSGLKMEVDVAKRIVKVTR